MQQMLVSYSITSVSNGEQCRRHGETERSHCLVINNHFKFCGLRY
jgi:hypothetical protein